MPERSVIKAGSFAAACNRSLSRNVEPLVNY